MTIQVDPAQAIDDQLARLNASSARRMELERIALLHARLVPAIRAMRAECVTAGSPEAAGALEWVLREMGAWDDATDTPKGQP